MSGHTKGPGDDDRLPRAPMGAGPRPVRARITRIVRMLLGRPEYASPEQVQARLAEVVPRVGDLSPREFHARYGNNALPESSADPRTLG